MIDIHRLEYSFYRQGNLCLFLACKFNKGLFTPRPFFRWFAVFFIWNEGGLDIDTIDYNKSFMNYYERS